MRIISDFHDYYDTVQAYGADLKIIYQRNSGLIFGTTGITEIEDFLSKLPNTDRITQTYKGNLESVSIKPVLTCFAGKPYLRFDVTSSVYNRFYGEYSESKITHCYTAQKLLNAFKENHIQESTREIPWYEQKESWTFKEKDIITIYKTSEKLNVIPLHRKYNSPVINIAKHKHDDFFGVINPLLKEGKFAIVKSPFEAYQEIGSFISGVLGQPAKKARPISDEIKRDKHGFDDKSFKTAKGTKKPRRKLRKIKKAQQ